MAAFDELTRHEFAEAAARPVLPPPEGEERLNWLRLIRSRRVGIATFWRLIGESGSAGEALKRLPEVARAAGVDGYRPCERADAEAELERGAAIGARLLTLPDPVYPDALRDIGDAPPLLWVRGRADLLTRPMVAMVGARNASSLGTRMAARLARELGEAGAVIASGLARGVDAAAHRAALPFGTVAALAGGVDVIYPPENAELAERIAGDGVLISEQPMGLRPLARHFPARNRLISGMARGVIVVEAAAKSGSLITARDALDQGRDVLAVPGHPFDARAAGCNMLIRDGATLVRGAEDALTVLGPFAAAASPAAPAPTHEPPPPMPEPTGDPRSQLLSLLGPAPVAEDQLIRDLGLTSHALAPLLTELELEGQILRHPGGLISLPA